MSTINIMIRSEPWQILKVANSAGALPTYLYLITNIMVPSELWQFNMRSKVTNRAPPFIIMKSTPISLLQILEIINRHRGANYVLMCCDFYKSATRGAPL